METNRPVVACLEQFHRFSTCLVASAIENFQVRLPNKGFANSSVHCLFKEFPPLAGYAVTARVRAATPPMEGRHYHYSRTDWWNHILSIPAPRVVVLEDLDDPSGLGAFVGEVNANIFLALGCLGVVTNGGVRDIIEVRATGMALFAGNLCVSHAYAHIVDFGGPAVVGGLEVRPGDLIHADRHGVQTIPLEIADKVPAAANEILRRRQEIVRVCRDSRFSVEKLRAAVKAPDQQSHKNLAEEHRD
jgi:4-hydroxy-4-methyl-2-oxoglutarate aldolase